MIRIRPPAAGRQASDPQEAERARRNLASSPKIDETAETVARYVVEHFGGDMEMQPVRDERSARWDAEGHQSSVLRRRPPLIPSTRTERHAAGGAAGLALDSVA